MPRGQPRRGEEVAKNLGVSVAGEVNARIQEVAQRQKWSKSYLVEQILRVYLGLPSDYTWEDLQLVKLNPKPSPSDLDSEVVDRPTPLPCIKKAGAAAASHGKLSRGKAQRSESAAPAVGCPKARDFYKTPM